MAFSPDKHSAVLIPVRVEDISSDIAIDCKINMSSWSTSPKTVLITGFVPVRLGNINSGVKSDYNINRPSWPASLYQFSSFMSFRLPVRLENINSDITS